MPAATGNLVLPSNGKGHGWKRDTPRLEAYKFTDLMKKRGIEVRRNWGNEPIRLNRKAYPRINDQGTLGSCTGQATRVALMYDLLNRDNQRFGKIDLSPLYAYYRGREKENCIPYDTGCEIHDVIWCAAHYGVATEKSWPYRIKNFRKTPPPDADTTAKWHQAKVGYYQVKTVDEVLTALEQGIPIVGGFSCYTNLESGQQGYIPMPTPRDRLEGGHAVAYLEGYPRERVFLFQNSWSDKWGGAMDMPGCGLMPFEFMENRLMTDCWAVLHE